MVGIKDVAKLAGVSIATVSNVINNRKPVSEELEARVNEAIKELKYEVNPAGRGLKSNRTNQVGVIVPSFSQVFFPRVLKGIHEAGANYGYQVLVFETGGDIEKEKQQVGFLQHGRVDGIIIASYANCENISDREYIRRLGHIQSRGKKIPVATLENALDPLLDAVVIDNKKAALKAVNYLLELGHRQIAHIAGPERIQIGEYRRIGYERAINSAGLKPKRELIAQGDFSPLSGYKCMKKLLDSGVEFTAVFVANDQMAIGAMKALMDRGKKIPDDVAVIGMDNNFPSTLVSPSLSTINIPKFEMGFRAMELLVGRIINPDKAPKVKTLDAALIPRRSTGSQSPDCWDLESW